MKKKNTLIGILTLLSITTIYAQDSGTDTREKITFGIKAGINYSNVWDQKGEDFEADPKIGFTGGVFFGFPIGKFIGIQPEVLLSQKGLKGSGSLLGFPYSFTKTKTFIDVPIQLQIKPVKYITILAGPQYSYLIHEKDVYTFGSNSVEQEQEFENDNIRKNILGLVAGIDVNISYLVISTRMGWDFQTNNGDGSSSTPRYKNQWIQLALGFKI